MKSNFYLFCIVIAVFFGSGSPGTNSTLENSDLALATVDSIRVDYIGTLNLMDVNPEFEMVLLFDPQNMKFVSADFDGNILGQFSKERDAPDGFAFYPMAAGKFNASKNIQIVSASGIFEYDIAGNLLNSTKRWNQTIVGYSFFYSVNLFFKSIRSCKILMTSILSSESDW